MLLCLKKWPKNKSISGTNYKSLCRNIRKADGDVPDHRSLRSKGRFFSPFCSMSPRQLTPVRSIIAWRGEKHRDTSAHSPPQDGTIREQKTQKYCDRRSSHPGMDTHNMRYQPVLIFTDPAVCFLSGNVKYSDGTLPFTQRSQSTLQALITPSALEIN